MYKPKYNRKREAALDELLTGIAVFSVIFLILLYFTNREIFWRWIIYGALVIIGLIGAMFLKRKIERDLKQKHLSQLLNNLKHNRQEDYLKNFINRFGFEGAKNKGWCYRNRNFDWDRINDLKKILRESGVTSKEDDTLELLRFYIQENEEKLTRESICKQPQKFTDLSGADFEKLLYRLFEAMGYTTEWIGKSGDQGGDLIANKGGERILIQAKCYHNWSTGNDAVQQAVGAMKYYNCNKAIVVTTSYFTRQAMALARANNVELIFKKRLQELLLQFLSESWG